MYYDTNWFTRNDQLFPQYQLLCLVQSLQPHLVFVPLVDMVHSPHCTLQQYINIIFNFRQHLTKASGATDTVLIPRFCN